MANTLNILLKTNLDNFSDNFVALISNTLFQNAVFSTFWTTRYIRILHSNTSFSYVGPYSAHKLCNIFQPRTLAKHTVVLRGRDLPCTWPQPSGSSIRTGTRCRSRRWNL